MRTVTINGIQVTKEQLKAALAKFDEPEYPRCFRSRASGGIVLFTALTEGSVSGAKPAQNVIAQLLSREVNLPKKTTQTKSSCTF